MKKNLIVTGWETEAYYSDACVNNILIPLLERLRELCQKKGKRIIAFIAAPPATGKSTLVAFLEYLAGTIPGMPRVQGLSMDGFHYHQDYILTHFVERNGGLISMKRVKGAPDTFDIEKLREKLSQLREKDILWPSYNRALHDVVEDDIRADAPIILLEGNYLLLDMPEWRDLPHDYAVFITADEEILKKRLIERKIRGNKTHEEAVLFYSEGDGPNVRLCLHRHIPCDMELEMTGDGEMSLVKERE